jgi:hypothetical protein
VNYPAYAQVAPTSFQFYNWTNSTTDVRALQKASLSDRIAATWYSETGVSFNVTISDGQTHRLALYFVDWDSTQRGQTVEVRDVATNSLLDSRVVTSFNAGRYLVWDISGAVRINVIRTAGSNAVVSGLFFQPTSSATRAESNSNPFAWPITVGNFAEHLFTGSIPIAASDLLIRPGPWLSSRLRE